MCYFNPSETNHTELVKNRHCTEVKKEKKWISEEPRNSPNTVTGKGIWRKHLAYSVFFTKLLDDVALPSSFLFFVSNLDNPYLDWTSHKEHSFHLVFQPPVSCHRSNCE